ncbi:MAG: calcineurin-like phosphoesterase C-terminal domain-containing protein [Alistipes sp.]
MKRIFTFFTALLLLNTLLITACNDSDEVIIPDGRLVTEVVIPTALSVSEGQELPIIGQGFKEGDVIGLRADDKLSCVTLFRSSSEVVLTIPAGVVDGGVYKFVLTRGDEYQVLGASKLTVRVAVPDHADATLKGAVMCDNKGVADVLVSDGDLITKTDSKGHYWLKSTKRNQVAFVILPSGYDVPTVAGAPMFWKPCTLAATALEQIDFHLSKSANDVHTMLVATDMHLANRNSPKDYTQFAGGFVKELTDTYNASSERVYCLNLGDFSWDGYWYDNKWALPECKKSVKDFKFQMWSLMGNHDNDPYVAGDFKAESPYRQYMGPVYYAMNIGKIHYIMLDNTVYVNADGKQGKVGSRDYKRRFSAEQLAWLKEELTYVDKATPIVVGFHCPLYYYRSDASIGVSLESQADVDNLLQCFAGFNSVNVLTGHTHMNRNIQSPTYANVYEQNIAAVCGTWWWTYQYAKNNVCTDGSPAGYKIFKANGTDLKWQYKATGLPQTQQFMTYDMNSVKTYWTTNATALAAFASGNLKGRSADYDGVADNEVFINIWDYESDWTVTVMEGNTKLDVKRVAKRDPLHTISYDIPRGVKSDLTFPTELCTHLFSVTASSPSSSLQITVTDRFGNISNQTMTRPKAFTTDLTK